ncbi:hypothetical protein D3C87_1073420 [compost metagenome]
MSQLEGGEVLAVDLDQGEIGGGIAANDLALEFPAVRKGDRELVGLAHDVVVGHDQALGIDDETGAHALLLISAGLGARGTGVAEERIEAEEGMHGLLDHGAAAHGVDVDDRRSDLLDEVRDDFSLGRDGPSLDLRGLRCGKGRSFGLRFGPHHGSCAQDTAPDAE